MAEVVFSEFFSEVPVEKDLFDIFSDLKVDYSLSPAKKLFRLFIKGDRLIRKERIFALEEELEKKAFSDMDLKVKVIEEYDLPENYTPEYVIENYYDSILLELFRYDRIIHTVMKDVKPEIKDGILLLPLPDIFTAHEKEIRIKEIFEKIFNERLHMDVRVQTSFKTAEDSVFSREKKKRIENEVAAISKRLNKDDAAVPFPEIPSNEEEDFMRLEDIIDDAKPSSGALEKAAKEKADQEKAAEAKIKAEAEKSAAGNSDAGKKSSSSYGSKGDRGSYKNRKGSGGGRMKSLKMSDDPNVVYGRDIDGSITEISEITDEIGEVMIHGKILAIEDRDTRTGSKIIKYTITDYTDTMRFKLFVPGEFGAEMMGALKSGDFVQVKGLAKYDDFDKDVMIGNILGIKKISDFREKREDFNELKRVELHVHTKMSSMEGLVDAGDLIATATRFGHPAVAVTDFGNVQSFPDASHKKDDIKSGIKILYGIDADIVDDTKLPVFSERGQSFDDAFVVFDIETTGFVPTKNKIIEIGAVRVENKRITGRFSEFVNPEVPIPAEITKLTSITDGDVMEADTIRDVLPRFLEFCKGAVLVAHNARFDTSFIHANADRLSLEYDFTHTDTIDIARIVMPRQKSYQLDKLATALGVTTLHHHRAVDDAEMTAGIFIKEIDLLAERQIYTLKDLNNTGKLSDDKIAGMHASSAVIFAKNEIGRRNLYRLVSMSHLRFLSTFMGNPEPKIPKSELDKYREGLIVGSGSENGDLMQALLNERGDAEIVRIASYYDYLEMVPADNLRHLIDDDRMPTISSLQDIRDLNKRIFELGRELGKPVCAAGDVRYLDPGDVLYARILEGRKIKNRFRKKDKDGEDIWKSDEDHERFNKRLDDVSESMYFMTTQEMMDEFSYLGSDNAFEAVVTNPNRIADMCDELNPVRPDKCPPVIADSDKMLRKICYDKAHELYGEELPEPVSARLERELNSIITNGFAVMYIIAQKLVWKSVEDGYLVGSRGSVGSSFVATMAGITEVNPLPPHYRCAKCRYSDFDSPELKTYAGKAGVDMPDKICPVCGEPLVKDGFDIPFETFLGFKGDKEPDIDLNFSSEYQSKAHKYTEVIFGAGQTYKAGTVGTLADKNAYGIVKEYYELMDMPKRAAELDRVAGGIMGVKNSTGQHPGGIVVLPDGEDINSFTPTQHPADDPESTIITTHFDYHKIDHNLLKLDILGHDDPTMIRMLQDLSGLDPLLIPLDDKEVMSLFQSTDALGITPDDIGGTKLGTLGIPEFGTDFAMGMLIEAKPKAFSDLVRIAGLSHGTDVWLGNAQELIKAGIADISTCICTRDDIMTYLIGMGLDPAESFSIMENVRKGKVAKGKAKDWPAWKEDMLAHNVPDWYVGSCEKIQYMFPKAHAAAYVMMGWRVAYYKINYPLAYYAAFFSIRSKGFSYEMMCLGKDILEKYMDEIKKKIEAGTAQAKDQNYMHDMRLVQEMYARGYSFAKIDIYKAKSRSFQIIDDKTIMPSFVSIENLGDTNAVLIEDEARKGQFTSRDDFKKRTKTAQKIIDKMTELHILENMPDTDQISIFDLI